MSRYIMPACGLRDVWLATNFCMLCWPSIPRSRFTDPAPQMAIIVLILSAKFLYDLF